MDATAILSAIACDEQALGFMEHVTRHVSSVQDYVLQLLLEANAGTDYFQRHGLYGIPTKEEFRRLLPITTYSDMEADFQRLANGDESKTICAARVLEMLTRKAPYASRGKSLQFFYVRKPGITSGGVTTTSGLSGYFTSPAFRQRKLDPESGYTSPDQVILCVDYQQASYCHLLCGLTQSQEVVSIGAPFASTLVRSLKALKDLWQELCVDIETGRVNDNIVSDLSVKHAVNALLKPDPKLAALVRRECSKSNWRGIVRRLWPRARIIQAIVTGSMQQYVPAIDFFSDGLPIASSIYAASECSTLGVNLSPVCSPYDVRYSPFPCFVYYEFLPVSSSSSSSPRRDDLVQLAEVELGREYELVITTRAGLYRYRVGDVLKVVGFKNSMPQFSFVGRAGVLLSVDTDKTDEVELHTAVTTAAAVMAKRNRGDVRSASAAR
ncbi:indole-3-acetic acid-amido synthetase GH3.6 [Selaginella moellendorffii]|uniref:indole-3-acetic acid-amido synthetase GH3.6 n=1 Tax=Selaginella moellendorffii TaxID=88036 RepID=UPI000D1C48D1|nr:indole-3-acetic acid-amido synthetase GH3.6 [Selaginella moellendorffii]|eukprot:XP_024527866.1 indole-3-acetic acid-amido synthetase GH3.6 [Selaginella moellendorffii]